MDSNCLCPSSALQAIVNRTTSIFLKPPSASLWSSVPCFANLAILLVSSAGCIVDQALILRSDKEKLAYVDTIIELLELEDIADALVGTPEAGLSIEQRKRLTYVLPSEYAMQLIENQYRCRTGRQTFAALP